MNDDSQDGTDPFIELENRLAALLNELGVEERVEKIEEVRKGLNQRLTFELRSSLMTNEELAHMNGALSPEAVRRINEARTEAQKESLIRSFARAIYHRKCAWQEYLYGDNNEKPFSSKPPEFVPSAVQAV